MIARSARQLRAPGPAQVRMDPRAASLGLRATADALQVRARQDERLGQTVQAALNGAATALMEREQRMTEIRQSGEVASRTDAARRALQDSRIALEQAPTANGGLEAYDSQAAGLREQALDGVEDPVVRAQVGRNFDDMVMTQRLEVSRTLHRKEIGMALATLDNDLPILANEAATLKGAERDQVVAQAGIRVQSALQAGLITPEDAVKRIRGFREDLDEADVRRLITGGPEIAVQALDDPGRFTALSPERRAVLTDMALTRLNTEQNRQRMEIERAERAADKARADRADETMKALAAADADGRLDRTAIEARRGDLSAVQYQAALRMLDDPGDRTESKPVVADLYRIARENPDEAEGRALEAYTDGLITKSTLTTITGRVDSERQRRDAEQRREKPLPRDYELASDYIQRALRPQGLLNDEAANQRYAEAMLTFQQSTDALLADGATTGFTDAAKAAVASSGNALGGISALPHFTYGRTPVNFDDPKSVQVDLAGEIRAINLAEQEGRISAEAATIYRANAARWANELKRQAEARQRSATDGR